VNHSVHANVAGGFLCTVSCQATTSFSLFNKLYL